MIKFIKVFFLIIVTIAITTTQPIKAKASTDTTTITSEVINEQLKMFDFSEMDKLKINAGSEQGGTSFSQLVKKALAGELDLSVSSIGSWIVQSIFHEVFLNGRLMKELLLISLLTALLKTLTDSFKTKAVGEMGFYVGYMVLVIVLFSSFSVGVTVVTGLVTDITTIMQTSMPLMISLLVMSGSFSQALAFEPLIVVSINSITLFIVNILIPIIVLAASLQIVNYLTEKEILKKLSELIKKGCGLSLAGVALLFSAVLSLAKISSPILNNLALKTARVAGNAIPIVGGMLTGAMDTVVFWAGAVKSAVLVALVITVVVVCSIPIIKLLALVVIYKVIASVVEPVCDERVVKCIDAIGSFSLLLAGAAVTVVIMFVFAVMIMLSFV